MRERSEPLWIKEGDFSKKIDIKRGGLIHCVKYRADINNQPIIISVLGLEQCIKIIIDAPKDMRKLMNKLLLEHNVSSRQI
ncbi:MAG TPA: hypothetical protein PK657_09140 [Legionella sp.]|nr:hypothetical protein [Legionella sp.]